jgi:hypothetical protein
LLLLSHFSWFSCRCNAAAKQPPLGVFARPKVPR